MRPRRLIFILIFAALSFISVVLSAKNDFVEVVAPCVDLHFYESTYDFGNISVKCRQVSHQFHFVNIGRQDVKIIGSLASCGCTTVEYPHTTIHPFEKGSVIVKYSPTGRPKGKFSRTIRLETTGKWHFIAIKITGTVL